MKQTNNKAGNNIFMTSADPNASINGENEDENNKAKQVKIDFHSLN